MKAIAFAIICAAYLLVPIEEFDKSDKATQFVNYTVFATCIVGFWVNIIFEK